MPGTPKCAWCGSYDTVAGFDLAQCLSCGLHTTQAGERAVPTSQASEGVTVTEVAREVDAQAAPVAAPKKTRKADSDPEEKP